MDERLLDLQTPRPYLQSAYGRQQATNILILKPTLRKTGNHYEHILDFTIPGQNLGKDDEDLNSPLGGQKRGSCLLRTPALGTISSCSSGDNRHGPPSWSQTRFRLDLPVPFCPGRSVQFSSGFPYPHDQGGFPRSETGRRYARNNKRKSCEYCRLRKKKCSGNDVCIRCFRVGVHCVYMPDLVANRAADCLPGTSSSIRTSYPSPSPGTRNLKEFNASQLSRMDSSVSCVVSPSLNNVPTEALAQLSEKARKSTGATNWKARATRHQESSCAGNYLTQAMVFGGNQPILQNGGPNFLTGDRGSGYCGLSLGFTSGAFGAVTGDVDPQSTESQCVTPSAFDAETHTRTAPNRHDISNPREVFYDNDTTQPGHFEYDIHTPQPAPTTTLRPFPQPKESLDAGLTRAEAVLVSEVDVSPSLEKGLSLEPYTDLSSSTPPSSCLPILSGSTQDRDLMRVWAVGERLAWYDSTPFCDNHGSSESSGPRNRTRLPKHWDSYDKPLHHAASFPNSLIGSLMYRHFTVYRIFHLGDRATCDFNMHTLVSAASSQHAPAESDTRGELHERPITSSKPMTIPESMSRRNQVESLPIVFAQWYILIQLKTRPSPPEETENDRENREPKIRSPPYQETQTSKKSAHVRDRILSPVPKPRDA